MTRLLCHLFAIVTLANLTMALPGPAAAQTSDRPQVGLECVSYGRGPMLECLIDLKRRDGTPLDNAQITLGAIMPSMPMAHTIKPMKAASTGRPGEYKGTLTLEMLGVWSLDVDITGPVREKVSRNLLITVCKGDARCAAPPAKAGDKGPEPGHGHGSSGHKL